MYLDKPNPIISACALSYVEIILLCSCVDVELLFRFPFLDSFKPKVGNMLFIQSVECFGLAGISCMKIAYTDKIKNSVNEKICH